jgi:hypothetical protein
MPNGTANARIVSLVLAYFVCNSSFWRPEKEQMLWWAGESLSAYLPLVNQAATVKAAAILDMRYLPVDKPRY